MHITRDMSIIGFPALEVRSLLQRAAQRPWGFGRDLVEEVWRVDADRAQAIVQALQAEGYIEPIPVRQTDTERWETTVKGNALANASAAPPIVRATADRAVADLVARAAQVNASPDYAFLVERLTLFGSYLGDGATVNDVDVAVDLRPRHTDPKRQRQHEDQRIMAAFAAGRSFSTIIAQLAWPVQEVYLLLKHRSRTLSLHDERQHAVLLAAVPTRVVYERARLAEEPSEGTPSTMPLTDTAPQ